MSDIFLCFCRRNKREPNRLGFAVFVRDDLDTLTVVEDVVEWYDSTIDLGDGHRIAEIGVDGVGKIYRGRSFWQSDDISTRREYKYLIFEHVHLHIFHELASALIDVYNSFDRLYPVAVFGLVTSTCF